MKYLNVVCFLSLLSIENVFGLQCYATDLEALKQGRVDEDHVSDCNDFVKSQLHQLGWTGGHRSLPESTFRCFKVVIYGNSRVEVKGCTLNGGCGVLKETFKSLGVSGVSINECYECEGNKCNAGSPGAKTATGALILLAAILLL